MKALLLLSGGIDSPVAGHLLRDLVREAIHFSFEPLTDRQPEDKALALAAKLGIPLRVEKIADELLQLSQRCDKEYYFVLLKRLMLRKAEAYARGRGLDALVTGDSLGQVSSQTLENLYAIDEATALPVLRPLIALDKQDIISLAERIGTFPLSVGKEVCDVLGPPHPRTRASLERVKAEERKLAQG